MFFSQRLKISTRPSPYPPLPFYLLRVFQLLSALVTSSILCFFIYYLRDEKPPLPVPWTFIFLLSAALFTVPFQAITFYFHIRGNLSPRLSLYLNSALTVIWILGLSLLCWNLAWVLGHGCSVHSWGNEAGVMVCRMYKALAAFAITGTAASIGTLLLDLGVSKRERRPGAYGKMAAPEVDRDSKSPWQSSVHEMEVPQGGNAYLGGALWDGDQRGITRAWKANRTLDADDFGYAVPEGQTNYGGGRGESMEMSRAHL